jgi:hypothetical protein
MRNYTDQERTEICHARVLEFGGYEAMEAHFVNLYHRGVLKPEKDISSHDRLLDIIGTLKTLEADANELIRR